MNDPITILLIIIVIWLLARFLAGSLQKIITYALIAGIVGFFVVGPPGFGIGCIIGGILGIRALLKK